MRFPHSFTLRASSRRAKLRLSSHQRTGAHSGVQCEQRPSIVLSPRTIPFGTIARSTRGRKNLTEFPFEYIFFQPGLERL
jgi:hypothetical protein